MNLRMHTIRLFFSIEYWLLLKRKLIFAIKKIKSKNLTLYILKFNIKVQYCGQISQISEQNGLLKESGILSSDKTYL